MWIFFLVILPLIILNIVLGWAAFNLVRKLEKFEDYFEQLQSGLSSVLRQIRAVDIRGAFEVDDEVGIVFRGIKGMVESLHAFLAQDNNAA